jgi:hypothetical protein
MRNKRVKLYTSGDKLRVVGPITIHAELALDISGLRSVGMPRSLLTLSMIYNDILRSKTDSLRHIYRHGILTATLSGRHLLLEPSNGGQSCHVNPIISLRRHDALLRGMGHHRQDR